jgi:hypothetical protein
MAYIEANLANRFIQQSSSPAAGSILFAKKKDGWLRHCVDYRVLNLVTVKNWYPLPVITEMPDRVCEARICMKLDLRGTYNFIRMKDGDECEKAFRMH